MQTHANAREHERFANAVCEHKRTPNTGKKMHREHTSNVGSVAHDKPARKRHKAVKASQHLNVEEE